MEFSTPSRMKGLLSMQQRGGYGAAVADDAGEMSFEFDERDVTEGIVDTNMPQEKLQDADFFNKFDDDFDESDMKEQP